MHHRLDASIPGRALALVALLAASAAHAADMTYEISGTLALSSGTDDLGLDGASFTLVYVTECDGAPLFWTGPPDNPIHYAEYAAHTIELTLSGTVGATYDGVHAVGFGGVILRRGVLAANDFTEFYSTAWSFDGLDLTMAHQVHFPPGDFFTSEDPLAQTPYVARDVDFVNAFITVDDGPFEEAAYAVLGPVGHAATACAPCPGDLDDSGGVDFGDLLALLAAWGPCAGGCPEDLDDDGVVDFADLVLLLSSWGPCA